MNFEKQPVSGTVVPQDRRAYPRLPLQLQIELREEGSDVPSRLQTSDLSVGGCYVELMMTLPVGTLVNITLWLGETPVRIRARVVTRHPQYGNGVMFLEFQGDGKQTLEHYIDAMSG